MTYFDRINKQLVILGGLSSALLLWLAYVFTSYQFIGDLLVNLSASLITASVALIFVGYVRHRNTNEKTRPAYRLAKSSIHTTIYGTILDMGKVYGHPLDPNAFFKTRSWKDQEDKTLDLVKKLKSIKHTKTNLDFKQLPVSLRAEARNNIYELDQVMQLYSFALPIEVRIKLLELRDDYKDLEFVLAINPISDDLSNEAKTIIAISIFKLKMSVVALYLMLDSMAISDTVNLVDE
jgi:hypothetical protein